MSIPESRLSDAQKFLRHVLNSPNPKRERRWVPVVTADARGPDGKWIPNSNRDNWFGWPRGEEGLLRYAARQAEEGRDVYVGTVLYPAQERDKNTVESVVCLSVDQDEAPVPNEDSELAPTCSVLTSEGSRQLFWRLEKPIPRARAAKITKALETATGANVAGIGRIVRLPGTINRKPGKGEFVVALEFLDVHRTVTASELEAALKAAGHPVGGRLRAGSRTSGTGADIGRKIRDGEGRYRDLRTKAAHYRNADLTAEQMFPLLMEHTRAHHDPPKDPDDVRKLADSYGEMEADPEMLPRANGSGVRTQEPPERSEIVAVGRDTRDVLADAADALIAANEGRGQPTMFVRGGVLCRVSRDEDGAAGIRGMTVDALRGRLTRAARFVRVPRKGDRVPVPPPKEIAQMLHADGEWPRVPPLVGLSGVPVLRPDGTVHDAPGYDAASRIYYDVGPSGELPPRVPDKPSRFDVARARKHVSQLFQDFPFASDTDRANAWGMLLTPVARPWIAGPVPLALIDKPKMGSGASLLAAAVATIATGHAPFLGAPTSEEEWSKVITSALLAGQSVLIFDNIAERIDAAALSRALTSPTWAERLLGTNTVVHLPQRATWIATGNNIAVGGDMPRRCYRIRLDPKVSKPWQRSGFAIPDLVGWASENRGELVRALLILCVEWHRAGRPLTSEADDRPRIGGFEGWDRTVSGILAHAGIDGFLGNLDEFYEAADEDAAEWAAFLAAWHDAVGDHPITLHDLVSRFGTIDGREVRAALPGDLAETFEHNERGFTRRLGRALARRNGARYGDEGYHAVEAGEHNRAKKWRVRRESGTD